MAIRIVLADDHPIVLQGLQRLFERHVDIQVVASCADGTAAIEAVRAEHPDVLVLDLRMPGQSGLDVLRTMAAEQTVYAGDVTQALFQGCSWNANIVANICIADRFIAVAEDIWSA